MRNKMWLLLVLSLGWSRVDASSQNWDEVWKNLLEKDDFRDEDYNDDEDMRDLLDEDRMELEGIDALSKLTPYQRPSHTGLLNGKKISHIDPKKDSVHTRVTRSGKIYTKPHENTTGIEMIVVPPQYVRREKTTEVKLGKNAYDLVVKEQYFEDIANQALHRKDVLCKKLGSGGSSTGYLYGCKAGQNPLMIVKQLRSANEPSALEVVVDDPTLHRINQKNPKTGKAILDPDLPNLTYNAHTFGYLQIDDINKKDLNRYVKNDRFDQSKWNSTRIYKDAIDDETEIDDLKKSMNYVSVLQPAPGKSLDDWFEEYHDKPSTQKLAQLKEIFFKVGKAMAAFHIETAKLKGDKKADQHLSFKSYQHRDAHWGNIFYDEKKGVSLIDNETLCFSINGVDTNAIYNPEIVDKSRPKPKKIKHSSTYTQYGDWYSLYSTPMLHWKYLEKYPNDSNDFISAMIAGYVSKFDQNSQKSISEQITDAIKRMNQEEG
jgi:hypothetical protein